MGFQTVKIFGLIELDIDTTAAGILHIYTDIPGNALVDRGTISIAAGSRRTQRFRLQGTTKCHLLKVSYTPGVGVARIYGARVWARELPAGAWAWYPLPVIDTPMEFTAAPLPVTQTPEEYVSVHLPIPATSADWTAAPLPITPTGDWTAAALPVKPTKAVPDWASIEVDQ